jgi:hypothetical protein
MYGKNSQLRTSARLGTKLIINNITGQNTMVSKVDRTIDTRDFKKKIATVATSRQSIFRGFCCGFFIGFQWENGRIRTKWPQNLQKFRQSQQSSTWPIRDPATVDFSREIKLTILSTMVSKVDHTVDFSKKNPTTVDFSKKNPATVDLSSKVDCRLQCLSDCVRTV